SGGEGGGGGLLDPSRALVGGGSGGDGAGRRRGGAAAAAAGAFAPGAALKDRRSRSGHPAYLRGRHGGGQGAGEGQGAFALVLAQALRPRGVYLLRSGERGAGQDGEPGGGAAGRDPARVSHRAAHPRPRALNASPFHGAPG